MQKCCTHSAGDHRCSDGHCFSSLTKHQAVLQHYLISCAPGPQRGRDSLTYLPVEETETQRNREAFKEHSRAGWSAGLLQLWAGLCYGRLLSILCNF